MRLISDDERRARLAVRHALAPASRVADAVAATRAMTVLHATEPATVYLSLIARVDALAVADVDRALYEERTLVKQLAMRRTLFAFPRDLLPAAWGSASARVAGVERRRMAKDVVKAGVAADGDAWVDRARTLVRDAVAAQPAGLTAVQVREAVPEVAVTFDVSAGAVWGYGRVLTHLGATADLVRGDNTQHWRTSRPRWTLMDRWLGEEPAPLTPVEGYAALVGRWLATFGPGTAADLQWWLGATGAAVGQALADVGAEPVGLESGETGWVLPGDAASAPEVGPWAALLPVLDPTVMGWKARDFYLGPHAPALFDRNGNAGTTAWWDGRVVGCWVQDPAGRVVVHLVTDVPRAGRRALETEAERLTARLDGLRVGTVYPSPAMKAAAEVAARP
ncbi:MAG: winged helix DNA-binding domain-containing protein [Nocardioides sp.]